jgi:hypothetical protein
MKLKFVKLITESKYKTTKFYLYISEFDFAYIFCTEFIFNGTRIIKLVMDVLFKFQVFSCYLSLHRESGCAGSWDETKIYLAFRIINIFIVGLRDTTRVKIRRSQGLFNYSVQLERSGFRLDPLRANRQQSTERGDQCWSIL